MKISPRAQDLAPDHDPGTLEEGQGRNLDLRPDPDPAPQSVERAEDLETAETVEALHQAAETAEALHLCAKGAKALLSTKKAGAHETVEIATVVETVTGGEGRTPDPCQEAEAHHHRVGAPEVAAVIEVPSANDYCGEEQCQLQKT